MSGLAFVFSCEHGGNRVPPAYARLFASAAARAALASHRGFDLGAAAIARRLAADFDQKAHVHAVTRLLVEPNRSPRHPALFSPWSMGLDAAARQALLARHYFPHRRQVEEALRVELARAEQVVHVAVHSFTPVFGGLARRAGVGLLYDPARPAEADLARRWQRELGARLPGVLIRRNYPYRGATDGFPTFLRRTLGPRYLGFELELNQGDLLVPRQNRSVLAALRASLQRLLRR